MPVAPPEWSAAVAAPVGVGGAATGIAVATAALGAAAALATVGAAAAEAPPAATAVECPAASASPGVDCAASAEGTGGRGAWVPWMVEGTAVAGAEWGMLGAAGLARTGMCAGRVRTAGTPFARGCCGTLELLHVQPAGGCNSSVGGNPEPHLRQRIMASHHCVPHHTADEGVGAPGCHGSAADTSSPS